MPAVIEAHHFLINHRNTMKIANLVIAIIYSLLLALALMAGVLESDADTIIGVGLLAPPVILNWLSFKYWKE